MVQSCPAYMEPADLSKTLGTMLMGQLVRGGGSGDTLQHLGRGLECNATMAIIWSSLAGVEPWEKSKGLGGMVQLEACVHSEGRGGPLSVSFAWSKAAQHTWSMQIYHFRSLATIPLKEL